MERGNGHLPSRRYYFSICILEHQRTFRKAENSSEREERKVILPAYFMANVRFKNKFRMYFQFLQIHAGTSVWGG